MCVGSGGGSAKNKKGNNNKMPKGKPVGMGSSLLRYMDAMGAANGGPKQKGKAMSFNEGNWGKGAPLAVETKKKGGGGPKSTFAPMQQTPEQIAQELAGRASSTARDPNAGPGAITTPPPVAPPPVTTPPPGGGLTPPPTLPPDIINALNKRKQTTYGPVGTSFLNANLASGGGSGQVFG
jgi:hypothetical protein